ncbi:alpha-D-ribose 1-methylphosphonate 5-triphosphate diphosphatase [Haloarcula sp. CBA1130]|uniref:alpha-D-ribose 1-methylphosphonate 5-triphosphate diphosphatase n=1 Tax=unclassified Haloarcula TaxID=2624677 RepID=UPI001246F0FC|nr:MULTISPECIES: alpha-D-ribose 1-methylphosphonate 5-triphosphate diphosphatase [unclassified Haloarcula]KAA9396032.1 alpha-D-ribose 1-methylphosphonate 5-triphosphate diphosphatase [Haloarcula sp. CBA1129]KAA9400437.1 alpha-D-ribose 1-methylphosphonate 5-triphosphate diphosphatase [Haloarcula sp. CBA1130]
MNNNANRTLISGGTVVTPTTEIEDGTVVFSDGKIVSVEAESHNSPDIDATGKYVLPGLVDLHGDDIEQHLFPRAGERVDTTVGLDRCDIANASAGVTTKYHAIAFEDVPDDNRSIELARRLAEHIRDFNRETGGRVDNRLHLRCELTNETAVDAVSQEIQSGGDLVSLVSHIPGTGQYAGENTLAQRYNLPDETSETSLQTLEKCRTGVSEAEIISRARKITELASNRNIPVASHDDESVSSVDNAAAIGVDISEYPLSHCVAQRATELNLAVVMGAPNVVRGGSLWDGLDASQAIRDGVVDILCSDFRPQSLLSSVFIENGDSLTDRVLRVSTAPAAAAGLYDRGRLECGARADLIIVDPDPVPSIARTFVAGDEVYRSA